MVYLCICLCHVWFLSSVRASPMAQVKNLPAMQETQEMWVWSLGWEDALEEEIATHPSILAWKISWTEEPRGLQSTGLQGFRHDWASQQVTLPHCVGRFNFYLLTKHFVVENWTPDKAFQQTHLECRSAAPLGSVNNTDIQIIKILCERVAYYIK